jgi:hypothetical protein
MRRERISGLLAVMIVAFAVGFGVTPGLAQAASPQDICSAIAAGHFNAADYSAADLAAYQQALAGDATIQGYCSPIPVVPTCIEVAPGTPGAVQSSNGKWYANAPNGNAEACGHAVTQQCTEVPAGTAGAVQSSNGKWYTNAPNGNAEACGSASSVPQCTEVAAGTPGAVHSTNGKWYANAPNGNAEACGSAAVVPQCTEVAAGTPGAVQSSNGKWYANAPNGNAEACGSAATAVVTVPTAGVLGAQHTKTSPKAGVSPAQKSAAPLAATKPASGTLPFTGLQLAVFAIIGGALLAGGILLRATGRKDAR